MVVMINRSNTITGSRENRCNKSIRSKDSTNIRKNVNWEIACSVLILYVDYTHMKLFYIKIRRMTFVLFINGKSFYGS